ncbi:threonylcarbamoyladenosine tRNA methylthiotransferase MtaB [Bacilli bacterium PM5-9]|nr:threonylcarbamoyladenosine tRNA methylthiotransferase MtaB [Bacilli bacterium PM5-9]
MKTFAIYSLGCKVNSYESSAIARMFEAHDYFQVDFKEKADVYIINTCTVTNTGDTKSRKIIRQAIRRNKDAIVCAFGCYAQVSPQDIIEIEGVDIVLGTQYRHMLVDLVNNHTKNKQLVKVDNIFETNEFEEFTFETQTSNQRAYLKIQEGCNNFCTYCIIPYARGLMRSRAKDSIINEAKKLVASGYNEIILTGIHTGGYGYDLENYNFDDLLEDILNEVSDLKRLRISSIEINQITSRTLQLFKENNRLVNHLHIPIQSGSHEILTLMKRNYTKDEYLKRIKEIRNELPDIALTTDLIVGFPYENEELFKETLNTIEECDFFDIHVFPYSKRTGTPSATFDCQVDESIKKERVEIVMKLASKLNRKYINKFITKRLNMIVEGYDQKTKMYYGHSDNYIKIYFNDECIIGSMVEVELIENLFYPIGKVIKNEA